MSTTKTPKIRRHFLFATTASKINRTYGGEEYTLTVYENKGRGNIIRIGTISRSSRSHKGKISEAWGVAFDSMSKREQKRLMSHPDATHPNGGNWNQYYSWTMPEKTGIKMEEI